MFGVKQPFGKLRGGRTAVGLPTRCPELECHALFTYKLEEVGQEGGGIITRSVPCPKCGYTQEIGRLTARGVSVRAQINALRTVRQLSPDGKARLERLQADYARELTMAKLGQAPGQAPT